MVNNNSNLLTVVWVAIAVAIVASIATASITGDTIKVINSKFARNEVYTKAEVDAKLNDLITKITTRHISITDRNTVYGDMTCQEFCKTTLINKGSLNDITNQNCLFGIIYENDLVKSFDQDMCSRLIKDSLDISGEKIACICG